MYFKTQHNPQLKTQSQIKTGTSHKALLIQQDISTSPQVIGPCPTGELPVLKIRMREQILKRLGWVVGYVQKDLWENSSEADRQMFTASIAQSVRGYEQEFKKE